MTPSWAHWLRELEWLLLNLCKVWVRSYLLRSILIIVLFSPISIDELIGPSIIVRLLRHIHFVNLDHSSWRQSLNASDRIVGHRFIVVLEAWIRSDSSSIIIKHLLNIIRLKESLIQIKSIRFYILKVWGKERTIWAASNIKNLLYASLD